MIKAGKIPKASQIILMICAGIVLILALYGSLYFYPAYQALGSVKKEIVNETADLERLKILFPVQARAKTLEKIRFKGRLPFPERVAMPRKTLTTLPEQFTATASRHGMTLSGSDFDTNGLDNDSQTLSFTVGLSGKLQNFRQFLIYIISHPSFDSVSALGIRSGNGETKYFTLTLNIKIEKAGS